LNPDFQNLVLTNCDLTKHQTPENGHKDELARRPVEDNRVARRLRRGRRLGELPPTVERAEEPDEKMQKMTT